MGLFWRRKKEDFISLGLSAPDESSVAAEDQARVEEAERAEQVAQWKAESPSVVVKPEAVETVTAEPEPVEPVGIPVEQWAAEAAKLFEPSGQPGRAGAATPAVEERVVEWVEAPAEEESFFSRFRKAVSATRENIASRIEDVVRGKKQIDEATLEELEEILIGADIGVQTTLEIIEDVRRQVSRQALKDVDELKRVIKEHLLEILERAERARGVASEAAVREDARPYVLMVVGVNGVGKTTTIGKLANRIKADGYEVLI
ncbi:MAG TPA: signal recognition particle receptor subunit alpha, partial [Blastocatellia bacterium]